MSNKLGWFGVLGRAVDEVSASLLRIAPDVPRAESPEDGFRVEPSSRGTSVVLCGRGSYVHAHTWGSRVSTDLGAVTMEFHLFDDHWNYTVHDRGRRLAEMTGYGGDVASSGDTVAAAAALEIAPEVLQRYVMATVAHFALPHAAQERDHARVFPDDEFDVGNDWLHVDLARRVGLEYPEERGAVVAPERPPAPIPEPHCEPVDFGVRIVFRGPKVLLVETIESVVRRFTMKLAVTADEASIRIVSLWVHPVGQPTVHEIRIGAETCELDPRGELI